MSAKNEHKRITESTLKSLKPKDRPWFIKDTGQVGFQIKVLPSGLAVYQVEARLAGKGKVKKFKIGNVADLKLPDAKERARKALDQIRTGINPQAEKKKEQFEGMTLEGLLTKYLSRPKHNLKPRTVSDYKRYVDKQFRIWKSRRVADITKHEILDWYQKGYKTPVQTHSAFRVLNVLMNYAIGCEVIQDNPCVYVTKNRVLYRIPKRDRHIEADFELSKFLKAFIDYEYQKDSQKVARDLILLMLVTGLRFNEARSLRFDNIDFEKKIFKVEDTKNRRDHIVPLVALTYTMLRYRKEKYKNGSQYVFRIKNGKTKSKHATDIRKTLHGVCDSAGIKKVSPHDLRRTFASALNNIGVGYADMKVLMNHKSKDITALYIQNSIDKQRKFLMEVVRYYDLKIPFPENIKAGWSKYGTGIVQSALYGNMQPEFDPINPQDHNPEHQKSLEDEYWYGNDA